MLQNGRDTRGYVAAAVIQSSSNGRAVNAEIASSDEIAHQGSENIIIVARCDAR